MHFITTNSLRHRSVSIADKTFEMAVFKSMAALTKCIVQKIIIVKMAMLEFNLFTRNRLLIYVYVTLIGKKRCCAIPLVNNQILWFTYLYICQLNWKTPM